MFKPVSIRVMAVAVACSFMIACGGGEKEEETDENQVENNDTPKPETEEITETPAENPMPIVPVTPVEPINENDSNRRHVAIQRRSDIRAFGGRCSWLCSG